MLSCCLALCRVSILGAGPWAYSVNLCAAYHTILCCGRVKWGCHWICVCYFVHCWLFILFSFLGMGMQNHLQQTLCPYFTSPCGFLLKHNVSLALRACYGLVVVLVLWTGGQQIAKGAHLLLTSPQQVIPVLRKAMESLFLVKVAGIISIWLNLFLLNQNQ